MEYKLKNNVLQVDLKLVSTTTKIETDDYEITIVRKHGILHEQILETSPLLKDLIDIPIIYGLTDLNVIIKLIWIYSLIHHKNVTVILPKCMNTHFNDLLSTFKQLNELVLLNGDLESLENLTFKKDTKVVILFAHIILNELCKTNKRRLNTILTNGLKKNNIQILSPVLLNILDIKALNALKEHTIPTNFDSLNKKLNYFDFDEDSIVELIQDYVNDSKRIYLSLDLSTSSLKQIESGLKDLDVSTSRVDSQTASVVINSSKNALKTILKYEYDIYIMLLPEFIDPIETVCYFNFVFGTHDFEILIDESNVKSVLRNLKILNKPKADTLVIKDSKEYQDYQELLISIDKQEHLLATDYYYSFNNVSETIRKMDLSNLSASDYEIIRNYVKHKLNNIHNISVNSCQLATPSSPKDRSSKLNSLSNKISSIDYRCDCTCELFKNYSIGVLVWSDLFSQKKKIKIEDTLFVYQTTSGTWKYTRVN
jgi:hypothetical protein